MIVDSLCRAWIFGEKPGGRRIHLCGRAAQHAGLHGCYCGHQWKKSKGSKLCHTWNKNVKFNLSVAEPAQSVLEARVLELFGTRKITL